MNQIITARPVGFGDLTSALQAAPALSTAANALQASFATSPPSCNSNSIVKAFQAQFNSAIAAAGLAGAVRTDGLYDTATQTALQSVLTVASTTGGTAPTAATCSSASQSLAAAEGMFGGGTTGMVVLSAIAIAVVGGIGYGIYRMEHKSSGRRKNPSTAIVKYQPAYASPADIDAVRRVKHIENRRWNDNRPLSAKDKAAVARVRRMGTAKWKRIYQDYAS